MHNKVVESKDVVCLFCSKYILFHINLVTIDKGRHITTFVNVQKCSEVLGKLFKDKNTMLIVVSSKVSVSVRK